MIYPIPKPDAFDFKMNNIGPIALLDTFRKCTTKLFTNRLSRLLKQNTVLSPLNFCGLKEEETSEPIMIVNDVIEDAKEKGKEIWLVSQDIRKAYDSTSIESLELALKRIALPNTFIA
jgi:hypothetical protein